MIEQNINNTVSDTFEDTSVIEKMQNSANQGVSKIINTNMSFFLRRLTTSFKFVKTIRGNC